ncbi:type II toxin-antitoxin system VapC family toxin [Desulfobacterales bacterium HSG16]|nr:type II toxin-antitoxin system VapC family toxin [Desulfobacterales bacterium HSG16]
MNVLLDTHAFLWWITDDSQLSVTARNIIKNNRNILYWSAASSWEVAIKYALGRLPLPEEPETFLMKELEGNMINSLPIADKDAFHAGQLPRHHNDPFDRMLIAQAQTESLVLLSCDSLFNLYDVDVIW